MNAPTGSWQEQSKLRRSQEVSGGSDTLQAPAEVQRLGGRRQLIFW